MSTEFVRGPYKCEEEGSELDENLSDREFKLPLNGPRDVYATLEQFKRTCETHDRHRRKRCKHRYYQLGLMAKIDDDTTEDELSRLLQTGTRTFHVDLVVHKPEEYLAIIERTRIACDEHQATVERNRVVTGLGVEIIGECCRIGRMRNNCSTLVHRGEHITLTTNEAYRNSCFKQISFVINLKHYIKGLKVGDPVLIGPEVTGVIDKTLKGAVSVLVRSPGLVNSYDYLQMPNQCYALTNEEIPSLFLDDLEVAKAVNANYIIVGKVRCKRFLAALRERAQEADIKIIAGIDLFYISSRMLDLMGTLRELDYLWIPDMFFIPKDLQSYVYEDVVPLCKCLQKPIIGTVPIERCSDFRRFQNHEFLYKIDAMYIEKSSWCHKYPLIVKKLLRLVDFRKGVVENAVMLKNILTSYDSIVNFIIRTISSIECQAIFMFTKCQVAAIALGRVEIYCPVYVILPMDDDVEDQLCKEKLARALNLRRNLNPVLYTDEMNECNYKPLEYGVEYARKMGLLETGDFIITLEVCKEDGEDVQFGVGDDVCILRAIYLPPPKVCEKFRYN